MPTWRRRILPLVLFLPLLVPVLAAGAGAAASEPASPSLMEQEINYSEIVWTIIIFLVMVAILYPTAWKQVLAGLKAREERIRNDISQAEAARAKAEATLKEYQAQLATAEANVRQMIGQATTQGALMAEQIRQRGQQEAEEIKQRALRDIEEARKVAVADVYAQGANLAAGIAEKLLKRVLTDDDRRELVRANLEQLGKN